MSVVFVILYLGFITVKHAPGWGNPTNESNDY